jgi:hypothetical protein
MCFKSRSSVAHVAMAPVASGQWLAIGLRLLPHAFLVWHALLSPLPPLPSLPFPSLHLVAAVRARWETLPDEYANTHGDSGPGWAVGGAMLAWWPRAS